MNDDEVLDAMKQTLTGVTMDHSVEAIEQRGRVRRRRRTMFGVATGSGLAAVAALALALPLASQQASPAPARSVPATGATASTPMMTPAAFTLDAVSGKKMKLVLHKEITDPSALQSALTKAAIPAVVKVGVHCVPKGDELSAASQVYRADVTPPDYQFAFVITPAAMPANSELFFTLFHPTAAAKSLKVDVALVTKGAPMTCTAEK